MSPWKAGAAWVVVLVIATTLTWQIVSFADSQVSAQPVTVQATLGQAGTETTSTTSSMPSTSTSNATETTSTTEGSTSTSSTSGATTSSSSGAASGSTPTSTATTAAPSWSVRTITTAGGTVVVRHRPNEVELQAATPAPGFDVEIDDAGPTRVRVEFESDDTDIRVDLEWKNGSLDIEVED